MRRRKLEEASQTGINGRRSTCLLFHVYALCTIVLFHFFLYKHVLYYIPLAHSRFKIFQAWLKPSLVWLRAFPTRLLLLPFETGTWNWGGFLLLSRWYQTGAPYAPRWSPGRNKREISFKTRKASFQRAAVPLYCPDHEAVSKPPSEEHLHHQESRSSTSSPSVQGVV